MITTKQTLITLFILALAGCATMDGLNHEAARWKAYSQKTTEQYIACVVPAWNNISIETKVLPIQDGQRVIVPSGGAYSFGNVVILLDVSSSLAGSAVELKSKVNPRKFLDAAKACI